MMVGAEGYFRTGCWYAIDYCRRQYRIMAREELELTDIARSRYGTP